MTMINWGILGTSFISRVMAEAITRAPGHNLFAVAGRSDLGLDSFCKGYRLERIYSDYSRLITDPGVDVVYIAVPNHIHHKYVIQAARAGKAILCEKSLSVDMNKASAALSEVSMHGVFFIEGLMYLHHPLVDELVACLDRGVLGDIRSVTARYGAAIEKHVNPEGHGAIYNLGCYPASLVHLIRQKSHPENESDYTLYATGRLGRGGSITETNALLCWPEGMTAYLHCAEDFGMFWDFSINGSKGSLRIESNPWLPTTTENSILIQFYEGEASRIAVVAEGDAFHYQVIAVGNALAQGQLKVERPAVRPQDSLEIMQLLTKWEYRAKEFLGR